MYVAVGGMAGVGYTGRSAIVDPLGAQIAGLGDGEGVAIADISHERLKEARTRLPVLAQRRAARLVAAPRP
jgi:predicted amidohydrolase